MKAGVPQEKTAWGLNQLCGSGLRAVALGMQQIANGDADIIVAGGQESMSQAPHAAHLRGGVKMGDFEARRHDAQGRPDRRLPRLSHGQHGRERRAPAGRSPARSRTSSPSPRRTRPRPPRRPGRFKDEIVPVTVQTRKGDIIVEQDEYIRPGTTYEAVAKLKPAFSKDGTVTAANASGINDGAAAIVLMTADEAKKRGLKPLARIVSWATAGVDPAVMGTGPIPASRKALEKAGWKVGDLDLVEANEAFAAQALAVNKDMGWDAANRERQRRRHRHRPSDRRLGRPRAGDAAPRDGAAATPRRASRRCASAAAWASPCASSAEAAIGSA